MSPAITVIAGLIVRPTRVRHVDLDRGPPPLLTLGAPGYGRRVPAESRCRALSRRIDVSTVAPVVAPTPAAGGAAIPVVSVIAALSAALLSLRPHAARTIAPATAAAKVIVRKVIVQFPRASGVERREATHWSGGTAARASHAARRAIRMYGARSIPRVIKRANARTGDYRTLCSPADTTTPAGGRRARMSGVQPGNPALPSRRTAPTPSPRTRAATTPACHTRSERAIAAVADPPASPAATAPRPLQTVRKTPFVTAVTPSSLVATAATAARSTITTMNPVDIARALRNA